MWSTCSVSGWSCQIPALARPVQIRDRRKHMECLHPGCCPGCGRRRQLRHISWPGPNGELVKLRVRKRTVVRWLVAVTAVGAVTAVVSNVALYVVAGSHRQAGSAEVRAKAVIVPGAQVHNGYPMAYLRGRLDAALELLRTGRVERILVSGDAAGGSGDEIAAMTQYLTAAGVPPALIDTDPHGVSTHATCERAQRIFGYRQAVIVTQRMHLARAVALCRAAGLEAEGVVAECDCSTLMVWRNTVREWLVAPKAVVEMVI